MPLARQLVSGCEEGHSRSRAGFPGLIGTATIQPPARTLELLDCIGQGAAEVPKFRAIEHSYRFLKCNRHSRPYVTKTGTTTCRREASTSISFTRPHTFRDMPDRM